MIEFKLHPSGDGKCGAATIFGSAVQHMSHFGKVKVIVFFAVHLMPNIRVSFKIFQLSRGI